jgi:chromosome segregation protein
MLKRLDLIGFKSFAEKTRFDFPPGISAIVGPNGSGKSNVVDAVRWVLGEQSAKSLRGGEMADVIFNGSATRKSLGLAEVSMTFDNARRTLACEAEEVQITRRVYRDGTGEYLINNQVARLKDIKDLFLGSGAGTSAYSIIEQGRVDALLQASTKDRRFIFEEAAGISRFKAKKVETLRKLEAVDQNLARLRDIIAEVDNQHRRVRLEASKAQRYQEYSQRLRELRIGLGMRDYHLLNERVTTEQAELETLRSGLTAAQVQAAEWEAEAQRLEEQLTQVETELEGNGGGLAEAQRQIAALDAALGHEHARAEGIEEELTATQRRRLDLDAQLRTAAGSVAEAECEVHETEAQAEECRRHVEELAGAVAAADAARVALEREVEQGRAVQVDLVRQAGTLQTQAEGARTQLDRLHRDRDQRRRRIDQKVAERDSLARVLQSLSEADADLQERLSGVRRLLAERLHERDALRRLADHLQQELTALRMRRSDLRGRVEVLENLERSQEGLGTGVREVITLLNEERMRQSEEWGVRSEEENTAADSSLLTPHSSLSGVVLGLVADVLSVPREVASLIDLALGDTAQCFIVRDSAALDRLLSERPGAFSGRVSFLPLAYLEPFAQGDDTTTADRWVTCDHPKLAGLPRQLLGNVRIVPDLATARQLAADPECRGCRFVTRRGELLEPDGTLTVGTHHAEAGILSRKSELRDLRVQLAALESEAADTERRLTDLRERIDGLEAPVHGLEQEVAFLTGRAGDLQTQIAQHRQHATRLDEEVALYRSELQILEQEVHSLEEVWRETCHKAEEAERASRDLHIRLAQMEQEVREQDQQRVRRQAEHTAAQIAFAQIDERLGALTERFEQLQADLARGRGELSRIERHEEVLHGRLTECRLAMLAASAGLAEAYRAKEHYERQSAELSEQRDRDREHRRHLLERLHGVRSVSQDQVEKLHARELALRDLRNEQRGLVERLREDYGVDLETLYREEFRVPSSEFRVEDGTESVGVPAVIDTASSELGTRNSELIEGTRNSELINQEIADLRDRIAKLGKNVNLDSIQELAEVEGRANELHAQHDDLTQAEASLQEIIAKINSDSRRLFTDTYEAVRLHFQELFRKLFGGGMADVMLEEPGDVLESGIEVVARPPGKELRSISLLSGGEKTLTAVALLLAIFRSKPSPFCLLDEVDASLDEANTTRLAVVIREFLDRSQFIIITHKKRTMAAADVLYGITMQESGVSKQVAVRFEDWPDEEEQKQAA